MAARGFLVSHVGRCLCVHGSLHQAHIAQLVRTYGASTSAFRAQARKFLEATPGYGPEYDEDGVDGIEVPRVIPDAYHLVSGKITVWEVEITNPIGPAKLREYAEFWAELDATDIQAEFELRTVDRYGIERAYDMAACWCATLADELATAGNGLIGA